MKVCKDIATIARQHNICQEWERKILTTRDKEELVEMYLKGIDFCMEYDFPPLDFVKKNFDGIAQRYGIYAGGEFDSDLRKKVVALGDSRGTVTVGGYHICEVFIRHIAEVEIRAEDHAFVSVSVYDSARVDITATGNAKVCIHQYGGHVTHASQDEARIKLVNKQ